MTVRLLGTLAVCALGLAAGGCASLKPAPAGHRLTVMTYNIQYGGGGTNLPAIAAAIRDAAPDIVAMQEVDVHWSARSEFADQATALATTLGMQVRFVPIYDVVDSSGTGRARQFGLALLSRHPFVSHGNHMMTRLSTQDSAAVPAAQHGLLEATLDVHGTRVRVFNVHLDYRADPAVRRTQVDELLGIVGVSRGPILVFGDLNATPGAPELAPLFARFGDAWERGANSGAGSTMPAAAPARRIDYVLVSDDIRVHGADVPATTASDHRPVVVHLTIPASGPDR